ncbi:MAG: hypothetical protein OXH57_01805, partial [Ekhidna sp.]|nr:hypothetical protein [Ekhidna sp.]
YLYTYEYYHMNWGWSGSGMYSNNNNGWFKFDDIEINENTIKGKPTNFQYNRGYITGIQP